MLLHNLSTDKKIHELNLGPSGSQSYKLLTSLYLQDCALKSFLKSLVPVTSEVQFNLLLLISKSISHLKVKASVSGLNLKTVVTLSDFQKAVFLQACKLFVGLMPGQNFFQVFLRFHENFFDQLNPNSSGSRSPKRLVDQIR